MATSNGDVIYRFDPDRKEFGETMVDVLADKIVRGGGGNRGLVPMVPNQRVGEDEARLMAEWILDQAE